MNGMLVKCLVMLGLASLVGCAEEQTNTFKLVGELPPDFAYAAVAHYRPEPGTKCAIADWGKTMHHFNRHWRNEYKPTSIIEIRKVIEGCEMVVRSIKIRILAKYGKSFQDMAEDNAGIGIHTVLKEGGRRKMNMPDGDAFYGVCEWLFRTYGPDRKLIKGLYCKKDNERGEKSVGKPSGVYTVDQLPGSTIRMNIRVADKERPSIRNTWIEFPNGWKRCLGEGEDDVYGFCDDNPGRFSEFRMHTGEMCTIYPGCRE
ncbi:hypothetical protein P5705_14695 [Pseudomonas entomophila]|uniref:hypothetical protein n=1 Tax=Pseudomonas entomophila TaxID=312306 RepID=UPI0024066D3E|nr:hypothetical protein [Pseudomonas entomophila]MDF9618894.1 hypothetical protein [Pseudomonas entomophila]